MAMSKKCFMTLLLGFIVALGGAVAVVIVMTKEPNSSSTEDSEDPARNDEFGTESATISRGQEGSRQECEEWLRNPNQRWEFAGRFGRSPIATRETVSVRTGNRIVRNSYWLTGDAAKDEVALNAVKMQACMGKIPVVVIKMRPADGLRINGQLSSWDYYKPPSAIETWEEYDAKLNRFIRALNSIPAILILEPDLLMYSFDTRNQQYRWMNARYEDEFLKRAQRVISRLNAARVYVDAGNAAYLGESLANVDQMATSLLRLIGLRGFSINTMHFVNGSYNEHVARRIFCRTGLHYIVDTSRNGGAFSRQALRDIEECLFDPPNVETGQVPGWSWGSNSDVQAPRFKRWIFSRGSSVPTDGGPTEQEQASSPPSPSRQTGGNNQNNQNQRNDPNWAVNNYNNNINTQRNNQNHQHNAQNNQNNPPRSNNNPNSYNSGSRRITSTASSGTQTTRGGGIQVLPRTESVAREYLRSFRSNLRTCMSQRSFTSAHDANVWVKTPGESDGRLYPYGAFRSCLLGHSIGCDDACQLLVQTDSNARSPSCQCENQRRQPSSAPASGNLFPVEDFPFPNSNG